MHSTSGNDGLQAAVIQAGGLFAHPDKGKQYLCVRLQCNVAHNRPIRVRDRQRFRHKKAMLHAVASLMPVL